MKALGILFLILFSSFCFSNNFSLAEEKRVNGKHIEAIKYYELAANNGDARAFHWLGTYYYDGVGVHKDVNKAINYFHVAASMGIDGSMVYLANVYLKGIGTPKDCNKAKEFIYKFSNGIPNSQWQMELQSCY